MKKEYGILDLILSKRTDFIKLIFAALILALGSSLLANYITDCFKSQTIWILILAIVFISSVVCYFIISIIKDAQGEIKIDALFAIDKKKKNIFPIPRYDFSETLDSTMTAVFIENEAIKKHWEEQFKIVEDETENKDKVKNHEKSSEKNKTIKDDIGYFSIIKVTSENEEGNSESDKILEETVEYVILEELSTHLSNYFNDFNDNDSVIKEFTRNDFPEILLQNRIINILSTPFEDREIFVKGGMSKNDFEGEVVSIYGQDGSRFSKFELVLPFGSIVNRIGDGFLKIENSRIVLLIEIINEGFGGVLPHGFEYNYLGKKSMDLDVRQLQIILNYKIKPLALLHGSKWNYHNWIDSFIKRLVEFASFEDFLQNINWESNLTGIILSNQKEMRLKENLNKKITKPNTTKSKRTDTNKIKS